ncbi:MAG: hypothetical protein AAF653_02715 [Chloroflexota bacterium]
MVVGSGLLLAIYLLYGLPRHFLDYRQAMRIDDQVRRHPGAAALLRMTWLYVVIVLASMVGLFVMWSLLIGTRSSGVVAVLSLTSLGIPVGLWEMVTGISPSSPIPSQWQHKRLYLYSDAVRRFGVIRVVVSAVVMMVLVVALCTVNDDLTWYALSEVCLLTGRFLLRSSCVITILTRVR